MVRESLLTVSNVAPLVDSIEIAQIFIKCSPTVDFINWDFLNEYLFGVRLGDRTLLLPHVLPFDLTDFKECVLFDLLRVSWSRTQTLLWVAIQQSNQEISSLIREEFRELKGTCLDIRVQLVFVV